MQVMTFSCPDCNKELELQGVAYINCGVSLVGQCPQCQGYVQIPLGDVMFKLIKDNDKLPTHFAS